MSGTLEYTQFTLPPSIVTRVDVSRLVAELERLDSDLVTRDVHIKIDQPVTEQLTFSEQLSDFFAANSIEIGDSVQRGELIRQVRRLKDMAPIVHVTFAIPADIDSLRQLVSWLRQSVHPQSIMMVGLQPSLIGGVYVRTPNHVHDFSMRAKLAGHRHLITEEVEALRGSK